LIDGIDIASVGLKTLRSRISIIPQDPVLFSGTVRSNLDPFSERTDDELWTVLDQVLLRPVIMESSGLLMHRVDERGSNFSHGQRQLMVI
jgi:ABC-type multidrug transport system fused ATPase/permease subunit